MARTTGWQFLVWLHWLQEEPNHFHREDYYLAQIAAAICSMFREENQEAPQIEDFLLDFKPKEAEAPVALPDRIELAPEDWNWFEADEAVKRRLEFTDSQQLALDMHKNRWLAMVGLSTPDFRKKKTPDKTEPATK